MKDYYEILGVARQAGKAEIKHAYRTLVKQYHPDLNKGQKAAELKFRMIQEAYEILGDIEKRRLYDQSQYKKTGADSAWQKGYARGAAYEKTSYETTYQYAYAADYQRNPGHTESRFSYQSEELHKMESSYKATILVKRFLYILLGFILGFAGYCILTLVLPNLLGGMGALERPLLFVITALGGVLGAKYGHSQVKDFENTELYWQLERQKVKANGYFQECYKEAVRFKEQVAKHNQKVQRTAEHSYAEAIRLNQMDITFHADIFFTYYKNAELIKSVYLQEVDALLQDCCYCGTSMLSWTRRPMLLSRV